MLQSFTSYSDKDDPLVTVYAKTFPKICCKADLILLSYKFLYLVQNLSIRQQGKSIRADQLSAPWYGNNVNYQLSGLRGRLTSLSEVSDSATPTHHPSFVCKTSVDRVSSTHSKKK